MSATAFPDKARVLKVAEQIRTRLAHAQQLKLSGQQTVTTQGHVSQAEEIQRRLREALLRIQEAARDYTIQGVSRKLEALSRKLNLVYNVSSTSQATSCFLSCNEFYLEVGFHDNGLVASVKLVHTNQTTRDLNLDNILTDHTFSKLESHLTSLLHIYSQVEGQERTQIYRALSATENVLETINQHSQSLSLHDTIMTQPLGLLIPRDGGLPMKLTYFQHPHEALTTPTSVDHVMSRDKEVGVSASILVEKSAQPFMLSVDPNLFSFEKHGFNQVSSNNAASLHATFVLQHSVPIPVCSTIMEKIHSIVFVKNKMPTFSGVHINALIAQSEAEKSGKVQCTKEYHVVPLPSQCHYYRVPPELSSPSPPTLSSSASPETGTSVMVVPFIHPGSVIPLIQLLRKQLVYNTLISSILGRSPSNADTDDIITSSHAQSHDFVFDLSTQPPELITMSLSLSSTSDEIVFEFSVEKKVKLKVGVAQTVSSDLSNILSRSLSIPVTLYAALKKPETLLGPKVTALINAHHKENRQFLATVSS